MEALADELKRTLAGRVCILGIGNRMRGDDAAGSLLAERLASRVGAECIDAGSVPENYLEKVVRARPDTVLLVDAVDFGGAPGETRVFAPEQVSSGGLSTHALSLDMACEYLSERASARLRLLAIQPRGAEMGEGLSREVETALERLTEVLSKLLPRV